MELRRWVDARSRSIRLADLLIEVENDLRFSAHFLHPGEKQPEADEICVLIAAILAHGCNLGLHTMEKIAPGIAYGRLKHVSDWRLLEENQRAALAGLVHGISRLDAAERWGDGRTSASDGQRFAMTNRVLQRTYSTRFNDFALEFYSFVADNYAPFYSRPVECTDRDAPFVLDGVALPRKRPRSRGALHRHPRLHRDQFRRLRHDWYALLPANPRPAPPAHLLCRSGAQPWRARAGAPAWTPFGGLPPHRRAVGTYRPVLRRVPGRPRHRVSGAAAAQPFPGLEPQLRTRVRRGLLKVEQLHALARAVYYGQRGRISAREVYDQMNACSCLTLILACIIYWQAREISRIAAAPDFPFDPELIARISPIEWKNVILYGEIKIDADKLRIRDR